MRHSSSFATLLLLVCVLSSHVQLVVSATCTPITNGATSLDFSGTYSGVSVVNGATLSSSTLRIVSSSTGLSATAAWFAVKQRMVNGWQAKFTYAVGSTSAFAEGFAFVMQSESTTSQGGGSANLGYAFTKNIAIEFDMNYDSTVDNNGNHIEVHSLWSSTNSPSAFTSANLGSTYNTSASTTDKLAASSIKLQTGNTVVITYIPYFAANGVTYSSSQTGTITVTLSGSTSPILTVPVNDGNMRTICPNNVCYFGFTSSSTYVSTTTYTNIDITSFTLTTVPASATLSTTTPTLSSYTVSIAASSTQQTTAPLVLTAYDACGQIYSTSAGTVAAVWDLTGAVTSSTPSTPVVVDNTDGTYSLYFWTSVATVSLTSGNYKLKAYFSSVNTAIYFTGSEFTVLVLAGAPDRTQCTYSPTISSFVAGTANYVTVVSKDVYGNPSSTAATFLVSFQGAGATSATNIYPYSSTTVSGGLQYYFNVNSTKAQTATISIRVNGVDIVNSPITGVVISPAAPAAAGSYISGSTTVTAGTGSYFLLYPQDAYGNAITSTSTLTALLPYLSGNLVSVTSTATIAMSVALLSTTTPTFNFSYTATLAGTYSVVITMNSVTVQPNTYQVTVSAGLVSPPKSLFALSTTTTTPTVATTFAITLQAEDAYGNYRTTSNSPSADFTISLACSGGSGSATACSASTVSCATTAAFTANAAISSFTCSYGTNGQYHITLYFLEPFSSVIVSATSGSSSGSMQAFSVSAAAASATYSTITGVTTSSITAGTLSSFVLSIYDTQDNPRQNCTDVGLITSGVSVSSSTIYCPLTSIACGSTTATSNQYTVSYNCTTAATYTISASISGNAIKSIKPSSSVTVVAASPNLPNCVFSGGPYGGKENATASFTISSFDAFNNPVAATWTGVVYSGNTGATQTAVQSISSGTQATVSYTIPQVSSASGGTTVDITMTLGAPGSGSATVSGTITNTQLYAKPVPWGGTATACVATSFTIIDYDSSGAILSDAASSYSMSISFTATGTTTGTVTGLSVTCVSGSGSGNSACSTRTATFTANQPGTYRLHIYSTGESYNTVNTAYLLTVTTGTAFSTSLSTVTSPNSVCSSIGVCTTTAQAGVSFPFVVTLRDACSNLVSLTSQPTLTVGTVTQNNLVSGPSSVSPSSGSAFTFYLVFQKISAATTVALIVNSVSVSALSVHVIAGLLSPLASSWSVTSGTFWAGLSASLTLSGFDAYQNTVTDYSLVQFSVVVGGVSTATPTTTLPSSNQLLIAFISTKADYTADLPIVLSASVNSSTAVVIPTTAGQSQGSARFYPSTISSSASNFSSSPSQLVAGVATTLSLTLVDVYGNPWRTQLGDSSLAVTSSVQSVARSTSVAATYSFQLSSSAGAGVYQYKLTPIYASPNNLMLSMTFSTDQQPTNFTAFVPSNYPTSGLTVVPGAAYAVNTAIPNLNPSVVGAAQSVSLVVTAVDVEGNSLTTGGANVTFLVYSTSSSTQCANGDYNPAALVTYFSASSTVVDLNTGSYNITFLTTKAGSYLIRILVNGVTAGPNKCSGNTLALVVNAGAVCPSCTQIVTNGAVRAGSSVQFNLILVDNYNNPVSDSKTVAVNTPSGTQCSNYNNVLVPNFVVNATSTAGTYLASAVETVANSYVLAVFVEGTLVVTKGTTVCPTLVVVANYVANFTVSGLENVEAATAVPIQLHGFDAYGNAVNSATYSYTLLVSRNNASLAPYTFTVTSSPVLSGSVYANYQIINFAFAWEGAYTIAVTLNYDSLDASGSGKVPVLQSFALSVSPFQCQDSSAPYKCPTTSSISGQCVSSYSSGCSLTATALAFTSTSCTTSCASGQCVSSSSACPIGYMDYDCPSGYTQCSSQPYLCRSDSTGCPASRVCPPSTTLCADGITCAYSCTNSSSSTSSFLSLSSSCVGGYVCHDGRCAAHRENCGTDISCPTGASSLCPDGSCVSSYLSCQQLSTCVYPNTFRCPNGACRQSLADCPTPVSCPPTWTLCASGHCRPNATDCPSLSNVVCSVGNVRCPDGTCAPDILLCPSQITCPPSSTGFAGVLCASGACTTDISACPPPTLCPSSTYQCPGGACGLSSASCPTNPACPPSSPVLCPDFSCVSSVTQCVASTAVALTSCPKRAPFRCPDGSCVGTQANCPILTACPTTYPFRCPDGRCVSASEMCTATDATISLYQCGNSTVRCPSGACAPSAGLCGTPLACSPGLTRCLDGTCRSSCTPVQTYLTQALSACSSSLVQCPQSHQGFACSVNLTNCPQQHVCPASTPVRCLDATCAATVNDCPITNLDQLALVACADGSWQSAYSSCSSGVTCPPFAPAKCWDQTCRVLPEDCPPIPKCTSAAPYLCYLGNCRSALSTACLSLNRCPDSAPVLCPTSVAGLASCVTDASLCTNWFNLSINYAISPEAYTQGNTATPATVFISTVTLSDNTAYNMCPGSSTTRYRCKDGSCAGPTTYATAGTGYCRELNITCPNHLRYMCTDGLCAEDLAHCNADNGCPWDAPYQCGDGACTDNVNLCAVSVGALKCSTGSACADGSCQSTCPSSNGCSASASVRCHDRSCFQPLATTSNGFNQCTDGYDYANTCPANRPVRCADGLCVTTRANCPIFTPDPGCSNPSSSSTWQSAHPFRCADGSCSAKPEQCRVVKVCDFGTVRCPDGSCRASGTCPSVNPCPTGWTRCTSSSNYPVCAPSQSLCPDQLTGCPAGFTRCSTGVCVTSSSLCPVMFNSASGCASGQTKCWNGACTSSGATCPVYGGCPSTKPYIQSDGTCGTTAATSASCSANSFQCPNGACVSNPSNCYMPNGCSVSTPVMCADGVCRKYPASLSGVANSCPATVVCDGVTPFLCPDQSCAASAASCRSIIPVTTVVTANQYICPDLSIGSSCTALSQCPSTAPTICPDGSCRSSYQQCGAVLSTTTCTDPQVLCFDGTCAASPAACIARQLAFTTGSVVTLSSVINTYQLSNLTCNGGVVCANGQCVASGQSSLCPLVPGCSSSYPYRCADGSCVADQTGASCSTTATTSSCPSNFARCEDGICRPSGQCLRYAGCPLSTPFYCSGRSVSCTKDYSTCTGDALVAPPSTASRRLLAVSSSVTVSTAEQEACKDNCNRDIAAIPHYVTVSNYSTTTIDVSLDSSNSPRTQLIIPPGAFGSSSATLLVQPVQPSTIDQLPAQTGAASTAWNGITWSFSQRVLSTPFSCQTVSGSTSPALNFTVEAAVDTTLFNPFTAGTSTVTLPCAFQSTGIQGTPIAPPAGSGLTYDSCIVTVVTTANTISYTSGGASSDSTTPCLTSNSVTIAGSLTSVSSTTSSACACYNITSASGLVWSAGESFCVAFSSSTSPVQMYVYDNPASVPKTGQCPAAGEFIDSRQITFTGGAGSIGSASCTSTGGNSIANANICLGVFDTSVNYFHCVDPSFDTRTAWPTYTTRIGGNTTRVNYQLPNGCDGKTYAFVWITMPNQPVPPTSSCDIWCQYKWVIIGVIIGFLVFSVIAGYAILRLVRYRRKYKEKQAALTDLKERAQQLDEFAGGLGVADEEVDMVANPLVIEMQELEAQIKKVNDNLNLNKETETREIDHLEVERQRLHKEIERVKQLMSQQQKTAPTRQELPPAGTTRPLAAAPMTSSSSTMMSTMTPAPTATQSSTQRHEFGQAMRPGKRGID